MTKTDLRSLWLLVATFAVATAGLIYELVAGAIASYLVGDSVRQFSIVIGVFLSAMGIGAYLSKFVIRADIGFVWGQIALGIIGGFSAPLFFLSYAYLENHAVFLYGSLLLSGALVGLEIPLITRLLAQDKSQEHVIAHVLSVDYLGALAAALAFPILIVPWFGMMSSSLIFGLFNLLVAFVSMLLFRAAMRWETWAVWGGATLCTVLALWQVERIVSVVDYALYEDEIIFSEQTPYQQITLTRFQDRTRLFLNNSIQFDSYDEYRYHEALVHPAMVHAAAQHHVLILGGGDGMAAREVLKYPTVKRVTLVDLDPRVTEIFKEKEDLAALNSFSLRDPRLSIINRDAWLYLQDSRDSYNVIIADLPDPHNFALSKLYSLEFYALIKERLAHGGVMVTQAGSPTFAPDAFWIVHETLAQTANPYAPQDGPRMTPYHAYIPSFGDWGFVMAGFGPQRPSPDFAKNLRFMDAATWQAAQVFDKESQRDVPANSIQSHALVEAYERGWARWFK